MDKIFKIGLLVLGTIIIGCTKNAGASDKHYSPKTQSELKLFLKDVEKDTQIEIKKYRAYYQQNPYPKRETGTFPKLPLKMELMSDSLGITWTRMYVGNYSEKELKALIHFATPPNEELELWCVSPIIEMINNLGLKIREISYTENKQLVSDYLIDSKSCKEFLRLK